MKLKMNKKIAIILATLILTLSIGSAVFAASGYKDLRAWYNNIKIFKNGQQVQLDFEPFIIDGYTYVPLRAVGELFEKDFDWDGVNYTINIKDRPDSGLNAMMTQIVEQQVTISTLEAKVKSLEAELAKKPSVSSLSDLEKQLNKDYGKYKNVQFDIDLYESKGNIEVRIYIDTRYDGTAWNKITSTNLKSYLQDIVDDILYEYKDAKVTGFIEDEKTDKEVVTFTTSSKGTVSVSTKGSGGSYYDLEEDLNNKFARPSYGIEEIVAYESWDEVDLIIYVDWDNEWKYLDEREMEDVLEDIYNYIYDYYDYTDIEGVIRDDYDNSKMYDFYFNSSGYAVIY